MRNILFVGRIEYRKGIDILLKALDEMGAAANGITLKVIGALYPGQEKLDDVCIKIFQDHLAQQKQKKLAYVIEYLGPIPQKLLRQHYDWAGLLIMPSRMDNYPYVALEGRSRGCYLLASDIGGLPELLNGPASGQLFPVENSLLLAEIIRQCREHEREILAGLPAITERLQTDFSPDACYQILLKAYGQKETETIPLLQTRP